MGRSLQEVLIFDSFMRHTRDSIVIKEYFANEKGEYTGGRIICASAAKAGHYGLNMDSIRGYTDFDLMPRRQAQNALEDDLWVMKHRRPIEDRRETITHKDGEVVKVSVSKFPWILPGGEIVGVMCIARNITLREKARQQALDLMQFMMQDVLKPLLRIHHAVEEHTPAGTLLEKVIFRIRKRHRELTRVPS